MVNAFCQCFLSMYNLVMLSLTSLPDMFLTTLVELCTWFKVLCGWIWLIVECWTAQEFMWTVLFPFFHLRNYRMFMTDKITRMVYLLMKRKYLF